MLEILPNGTRIEKCGSNPGDMVRDGACGVIVARVGPVRKSDSNEVLLGYIVRWDSIPWVGTFIAHFRIKRPEPS